MKRFRRHIITIFAVLLAAASVLAAERPRITAARFEPDSVTVGDRFKLIVEVEKDMVLPLIFPAFDKTFADGMIEVLGETEPDTLLTDGRLLHLRKEYLMTSFEERHYRLDSLAVLYADKNIIDTVYFTEPLEVWVKTIPVDTMRTTIYDIKPPIQTPLLVDEVSGYFGWGLLGAATLVSIVYFLSRLRLRRRKEGHTDRRPKEAPNVVAIRELEHLHNQKLWQTGKHKHYYTRLTEILREYLDERFEVGAKEMTSDEILAALSKIELSVKQYKEVEEVLRDADLVKFAKYVPEGDRNEEAYYKVYYFVEETKIVEEEVQPAPQPEKIVEL